LEKSIAFFDFDGTITKKDSMLELARFSSGTAFYWLGLLTISPWLLAMKLNLISAKKAKEKLLTHFFGGINLETFNSTCNSFNENILPGLIKEEAIIAIKNYQDKKIPVVIVSASAENWVAPWCNKNELQFICTLLKVKNNKITGELNGDNCNGPEKVSRIKQLFNLTDFTKIYCYGDTKGDNPMLQLATNAHYKAFDK
jgi:HAD superfamily hydrolase (TIGR01490 family)